MPLETTASYQEVLDKLGDITGVNQKAELIAAVTDKGGVVPATPSMYDTVKALIDIPTRTDTITPGTTNKAIPKGFASGLGIVQGSANLLAANIKKDVNIFGIVGTSNPIVIAPATIPGGVRFNADMYGSNTANPISFPTFNGDIPYGTTKTVRFTAITSMTIGMPIIFTRRQITNIYQASARMILIDVDTGVEVLNVQPIFKSGGLTIGPSTNISFVAGKTYEIRVTAEQMSTPTNDGVLTGWYIDTMTNFQIYVDKELLRLT